MLIMTLDGRGVKMDTTGAIILLGGLWAASAPFAVTWLIRTKRYGLALSYMLPMAWFIVGYFAT